MLHMKHFLTKLNSNNRDAGLTITEAEISKNQGISMLVVGIGNKIQLSEVSSIASYPAHDHLFLTNNFDDLPTVGNRILDAICRIAGMYMLDLFNIKLILYAVKVKSFSSVKLITRRRDN